MAKRAVILEILMLMKGKIQLMFSGLKTEKRFRYQIIFVVTNIDLLTLKIKMLFNNNESDTAKNR
jgi:hypothetical protein